MHRSRRAIFILAAYWLAIFAGPSASAALRCDTSAPVASAAMVRPDCPMAQAAGTVEPESCCCCSPTAAHPAAGMHAEHATVTPAADPCACSFESGAPVELPDAAVVAPLLSALALLPRPASVPVAPSVVAAPQAPIRGPSSAPPLPAPLAPDAGRAPPAV